MVIDYHRTNVKNCVLKVVIDYWGMVINYHRTNVEKLYFKGSNRLLRDGNQLPQNQTPEFCNYKGGNRLPQNQTLKIVFLEVRKHNFINYF